MPYIIGPRLSPKPAYNFITYYSVHSVFIILLLITLSTFTNSLIELPITMFITYLSLCSQCTYYCIT